MEFTTLTQRLAERLTQPLPGLDAHQDMVPDTYKQQRFSYPSETIGRQSGVLVLLYEKAGEVCLPLIQRPTYEGGAHSGQIAFPGGKHEPEDADLVETALREAQEEVGVDPATVTVLGNLSKLYIQPSGFWVLPTVGIVDQPPHYVPDRHEVAEVLETTLTHLSNPNTLTLGPVMANLPHFPYFNVQDRAVWGATAMMLSELIAVYREIRA